MANEVTINIESSLAAMAYVLAEQQQQIKTLQAEVIDWKQKFIEANAGLSNATTENINYRDELKIGARKLEELEKDYKALSDANMELCEHNTELKDKMLDWHEIGDYDIPLQDYELPFNTENCPQTPCILLKIEYIKDGCFDNANHPIPINTRNVVFAYPCLVNGRYTLNHNDTYTKAIAWCVVSDKNF